MFLMKIKKPLLIYDGECGFCRYCVNYLVSLVGQKVKFSPFQIEKKNFPKIPLKDFKSAIVLINPNGEKASGAEAGFGVLALGGYGVWHWIYKKIKPFSSLSEGIYRWIARHRNLTYKLCKIAFGRDWRSPRFERTVEWFYTLLAITYISAFLSLSVQILGLVGSNGITPAQIFLNRWASFTGIDAYINFPSIFWFNSSDIMLQFVCLLGALSALGLCIKKIRIWAALVCYLLYLSYFSVGQIWLGYQWDIFLLEVGFLAIFLPLWLPVFVWMFRLLVFKFFFLSGMVKVLADENWRNLTALDYHFETQPIPNTLSYVFHSLPEFVLKFGTGGVLFVQLVIPFLIFAPRNFRYFGLICMTVLELLIMISGNYNFFNILTLAICVLLLDDQRIERIPQIIKSKIQPSVPGLLTKSFLMVVVLLYVPMAVSQSFHHQIKVSDPVQFIMAYTSPLKMSNSYGLFANMTTKRPEIVIEGSMDGESWRPYEFKYKPGDLNKIPRFTGPHQPRLDWQMWFAALKGNWENVSWWTPFIESLFQRNPEVLSLLESEAFPQNTPKYIRATLYEYNFAEIGSTTWWTRKKLGTFMPKAQFVPE